MAVEYSPNAYVVGEDGAPECSPAIPRTSGGESILDFGYRASAPEDYGQALAEHDPNEPVPIAFNDPLVDLTAPAKAAYGKPIPYNWQLTGSCFPAGVPVRMADGNEKPIEQVQVGDEVITHTGKTRKVVNVMCRNYTGDLVTVRPEGFPFPLMATADHPFAVWRDRQLTWVHAGDLTEDDRVLVSTGVDEGEDIVLDASEAVNAWGHTRHDKAVIRANAAGVDLENRVGIKCTRFKNWIYRNIPVTPSFARLIGLYLAEGGVDEGRVVFTFHRKERDTLAADVITLIRGVFGVSANFVDEPNRPSVVKVHCTNTNVARFMKWLIPGNVYTKRVPGCLLRSTRLVREALLKGWLDGDGHARLYTTKRGPATTVVGVTACPQLARDMLLVAASCGHLASGTSRPPYKHSREAFTIKLSGDRGLAVYPELQMQAAAAGVAGLKVARSCKLTPFGIARRVKQTTRQAVVSLPVYDFEVEEDHSFVAGGLVVHNCVNGGGFNALVNRIGVEIATGRQAEAFELPFTLMTYGLSRWLAFRDNTEGEGSAGAAFVSAAKEGGLPPFSDPDVPKPAILVSMDGKHAVHAFSRRDEFYWSSVRNHTAGIKERAKKVTIQYVRIRSADQGEVEIRRGRTITWAGMWGGLMRVPVEGGRKDSKVLLNRHASSWSHQQSCSMMWHHRDLGRIWNIQNQWFGPGPNTKVETVAVSGGRAVSRILEAVDVMSVHGDPVDPYSPLGSYWISDADFEYQCARGEVFATYLIGGYSGLVGVGSV